MPNQSISIGLRSRSLIRFRLLLLAGVCCRPFCWCSIPPSSSGGQQQNMQKQKR